MKVRSDLGYTKSIGELNKRLEEVDHKLMLLLFSNTEHKMSMTETELENILEDGNGTYWDYEDEKMSPYGSDEVVSNLLDLDIADVDDNDIFYDFNSRLHDGN